MASMDTIKNGQIKVLMTAVQMPDVSGNLIKVKAASSNSGKVYIGGSTITVPNSGDTNTTAGYELGASEETWLPVSNLKNLYCIGQYDGDKLVYLSFL
jgi:hypothetical protein